MHLEAMNFGILCAKKLQGSVQAAFKL